MDFKEKKNDLKCMGKKTPGKKRGISWQSRGQDSALQCRGHGYGPWSRSQDPACLAARPKNSPKKQQNNNNRKPNDCSIRACPYLFIYLSICLFIFGCIGSQLLHAGFLQLRLSGGYSLLQCVGFSLRWLLRSTGSKHTGFSSCGSWALERRLSSCGAQTQLLHGMWDLPGPGLEPLSPALADRFLTIAPPGKSLSISFYF